MIPILYEVGTSEFSKNGIGRLINAVSCSVGEGRNGEFELTMRYRVGGQYYNELAIDRVIAAIPYEGGKKQGFDIYNIVNNLDGTIEVMARHISYRANFIPVRPFSAHGITQTISRLYENCLEPNPFTIYTDITNEETDYYEHTVPRSLRACLGGNEGSFLDIWTSRGYGEYLWDNLTINFLKKRGADNGYTIRYAKNLVDLSQEFDAEDHVTGVLPYWVSSDTYEEGPDETDIPLTIWGEVQHADNITAPYYKTIAVDFSEKFTEEPSIAQLNAMGKAYANEASTLIDSLDIDFYDENDQNVHLCDTVKVIFTQLGIERKFQVIKTKWDVLLERYSSITLGANKSDLASTLIGYNSDTLSKISNSNNKMISVIQHVDYEIGEISDRVSEIDTRIEQGVTGVVAYYLANDGTTPSKTDTRWSTAFPSDISGKTVWVLYETSYIDETSERSNPVKYGGEGKYVTAAKTQYYVSNSSSTQSGGSWSDGAMPSVPNGKFLWTRQALTYSDGTTGNTTPTLILSDLYSITTSQQTQISQNTEAIALRATKTEVTTAINKEVTDRNDAISTAIGDEAAARDAAIEAANARNLSPFFSRPFSSLRTETVDPKTGSTVQIFGYWHTIDRSHITKLDDGWAHVKMDNSSGSDLMMAQFCPYRDGINLNDDEYTILIEIRNLNITSGSPSIAFNKMSSVPSRYGGKNANVFLIETNTARFFPVVKYQTSAEREFYSYFRAPAGTKFECDARISLYKAGYTGEYIPYVDGDYYNDTRNQIGVNLSPYFANDFDDIYDLATNPTGYWKQRPSASYIGESDRKNGWAAITCDNTNGTSTVWPIFYNHVAPHVGIDDDELTMLVEIKSSSYSGTCLFWNSSTTNGTNTPMYGSSSLGDLSNGKHYLTLTKTGLSDPTNFTRSGFEVPAGGRLQCLVRVSVYRAGYNGDFVPYTSDREFLSSKYATSAELSIEADKITSRVSSTESKIYSLENEASTVDSRIAKAKQEAISSSSSEIKQSANEVTTTITQSYQNYVNDGVGKELGSFKDEVETYMTFSSNGLELGKSNSDFKAKLSNDELAFMQGSDKVAYISSNKLYITQAEITNNLKLGKYEWTQEEDGRISLRWRG